jgi:hypothetical protein
MDYATAYRLLLQEGDFANQSVDTLLLRLQQQKPPIPGQVTTLLLALKVLYEGLKGTSSLDRKLVISLYCLAYDAQTWFQRGQAQGVTWPPLLEQDLERIRIGVRSIFADQWDT